MQLTMIIAALLTAAVTAHAQPVMMESDRSRLELQPHCGIDLNSANQRSQQQQLPARRKRIVGGKPASDGIWNSIVSIVKVGNRSIDNSQTVKYICYGVLITKQWLVTDSRYIQSHVNDADLQVRIGGSKSFSKIQTRIDVDVERIVVHPGAMDPFNSDDIALVKMSEELPDLDGDFIMCLPGYGQSIPEGTRCHAAGWGATRSPNPVPVLPEVLHEAAVNILSQKTCAENYGSLSKQNIAAEFVNITDKQICAGLEEGGVGGCIYDEGSPLVCEFPNSPHRALLAGIGSFGFGCGEPGFPGVYTNISAYFPWIQRVVNQSD